MRVQQEIADVFPWPFSARPRAEKLDGIAIRLRPLAIPLERFVKPPPEVFLLLFFRDQAPLEQRCSSRSTLHRLVPAELPLVESEAVNRIDVGSASDLVMAENSGFKENTNGAGCACASFNRVSLEEAMKFGRKRRRHHGMGGWRIDAEGGA